MVKRCIRDFIQGKIYQDSIEVTNERISLDKVALQVLSVKIDAMLMDDEKP